MVAGERNHIIIRSSTWSDSEVAALISIWGEADIQEQLDGATRNKTIYVRISKKLEERTKDEKKTRNMSYVSFTCWSG